MNKKLFTHRLVGTLLGVVLIATPVFAHLEFSAGWQSIYRGVDYASGSNVGNGHDQDINALRIDLTDPEIQFFSTPSGGSLETVSQTSSQFRDQNGLQVAVNANFFSPCCDSGAQDKSLSGLAVSAGNVVSPQDSGLHSVMISQNNQAVQISSSSLPDLSQAYTAVAGNFRLLNHGSIGVSPGGDSRARTAAGLSQDNRYLYLFTVDEGFSTFGSITNGATIFETAEWMTFLGASDAINLDGGGSTTMVREDPGNSSQSVVLNTPRGSFLSQGTQRYVGNNIGVSAVPVGTPFPTVMTWGIDEAGAWTEVGNWSPVLVPNANTATAIFGPSTTSASTVFTDSAVTVKSIQFNNSNSYGIAGTGSVNLVADAGNANIDVLQGSHEFQAIVNLNSPTNIDIVAGASLAFNNELNLNGNNLNKIGAGTMNINNTLSMGGGVVSAAVGVIAGSGTLLGDLDNTGGTVAPGNSPGTLTIEGNYTQGTNATLAIELAGLGQGIEYDLLDIAGTLTLNGGTLDVTLLDGFNPSAGDVFDVLDFSAIAGIGFTSLSLPALGGQLAWDTSGLMTTGSLSVTAVPEPASVLLVLTLGLVAITRSGRRR